MSWALEMGKGHRDKYSVSLYKGGSSGWPPALSTTGQEEGSCSSWNTEEPVGLSSRGARWVDLKIVVLSCVRTWIF
jgi:hypothetical protein